MRIDKVIFALSLLLISACSSQNVNDTLNNQTSEEYKTYDNKLRYCRDLESRKIDKVEDLYFNSLTDRQKNAVISILSRKALDRCSSHEELSYLKEVIATNDEALIGILSKLYKEYPKSDELKMFYQSLDYAEIERLSNSETFNMPFNRMDLTDKLGLY